MKSRKITYVTGTGKLVGPDSVEVGGEVYKGRAVVLATGSYARSLPGLDIGGRIITSEEALEMDYVPDSAIVLGGGVIGVEFASVWKSFGTDVTIVEALPTWCPQRTRPAPKPWSAPSASARSPSTPACVSLRRPRTTRA